MMELLLDISWLAVTELLVWRRVAILEFASDASVGGGWWSGLAGFANVDKSGAVDIFLEAVGCITKVLCTLLLRTCSKDIGATQSGKTTFGGETGPTPASQECRDTIKQRFLWYNGLITLQYRNQTSQAILLVGHFVFPRSVFTPSVMLATSFLIKWLAIKMIVSRLSSKAFLGWAKLQLVLVHSFPLQVKFPQAFGAYPLGRCPLGWWTGYGGKTYPDPSSLWQQCQPLLHDGASFASDNQKGFPSLYRCCGIALASVTLFGHESGVGSGMRCTICEGILIILP